LTPRAVLDGNGGALRRTLWLIAVLALVAGLAFLVARPRSDGDSAVVAYTGAKGPRAPGLQILLRRGLEARAMEPGTGVRAGDALRLTVRSTEPRYLVVRVRDSAGGDRILFPANGAPAAVQVRPGETLPGTFVVGDAPGTQTIFATFSHHPFAVADPPRGDLEIVTIDLPKER
jgi:hypothetical protein